ncbi:MAG: diguanylate cyclase response regulator [Pseudomonadota bacterium]
MTFLERAKHDAPSDAVRVLHIEDDPTDALMVARQFRQTRLNFQHVETLSLGGSILRHDPVDVILLDVNLPDSQGVNSIEYLKRRASDIPICCISGNIAPEGANELIRAGAQDVLEKSYNDITAIERSLRFAILRERIGKDLRVRAHRDPLTGLPNRQLFEDRLASALARSRRHQTQTAVIYLDLNDFKSINDTYGHAIGDAVLKWVADRLIASVRESDTVARLGGDEFAVVLETHDGAVDFEVVREKIEQSIAEPLRIGGTELRSSVSVGVALASADPVDQLELLERADAAMYRHKAQQKSNF